MRVVHPSLRAYSCLHSGDSLVRPPAPARPRLLWLPGAAAVTTKCYFWGIRRYSLHDITVLLGITPPCSAEMTPSIPDRNGCWPPAEINRVSIRDANVDDIGGFGWILLFAMTG